MPQQLYSTEECQQRSAVPPDFGPGDFVVSCWTDQHELATPPPMQVLRVYVTRDGLYAFDGTRGQRYAGFFRKGNPLDHTKTDHRIGVPKNKLP